MQLKTVCMWPSGEREQARIRALRVITRELELILMGWELLNVFEQEYSATFQHHLMTTRYLRLHMPQKLIPDFCPTLTSAFPHLSE